MSNEAVITVSNDPLKSVADALDSAVQAAKGGVEDLRLTASGALPALGSFFSGVTFKTCYGMVFPTVLRSLDPGTPYLARFARALHTAIKKGRGDPTFSLREKVPRRGG
jgi:hypothetical protein